MAKEISIGDEVWVHGFVDEIRRDAIIIRNDGGYFGTVPSEVFCYEEDRNGYGTMNSADTPQTDSKITRNALRTDCNGCRFVGTYDTEFPCANCTRKNKDYYDADTPQTHKVDLGNGFSITANAADTPQTDNELAEMIYENAKAHGGEVI